ncbi:hypothetical protein NE237_022942 [Protea cynaroides]|uniref:Uncharacterized protein n=1 Tax=Protea cynaroides TaxID=273540 RepID=A0A9Q0K690_9MAGN|nr:hypothetical protein NE237_022942 [Protea cynaroides]
MSSTYYSIGSVGALTFDDSFRSEPEISMTYDQTSFPFTFRFRNVHLKMSIYNSNVQIIDSPLIEVQKKLFSLDSLSSYETLNPCIRDMLLNTEEFHIRTDFIEPLEEQIAINICHEFKANQAREVRTVGFEAEIKFHMVEECKDDEETTMEDIIEATMDIEPAFVPASKNPLRRCSTQGSLRRMKI